MKKRIALITCLVMLTAPIGVYASDYEPIDPWSVSQEDLISAYNDLVARYEDLYNQKANGAPEESTDTEAEDKTEQQAEWSANFMSNWFPVEPDKTIRLTDDIELQYYSMVINDRTNRWRLVLTDDEFDIYDYMKEYYDAFPDAGKNKDIHCLIYCAEDKDDRTTTCVRFSEDSIDATVYKSVSGEAADAGLMFTGEYIKERVYDVNTDEYFDYDE